MTRTMRSLSIFALLLVAAIVGQAGGATARDEAVAAEARAGLVDLVTAKDGLSFRLVTPGFSVADARLSAVGLADTWRQPGAPPLPARQVIVALPPGAELAVTVREADVVASRVGLLAPEPSATLPPEPSGEADGDARETSRRTGVPQTVLAHDPAVYERDAYVPSSVHALSDVMYFRDARLALLTLTPLRYNPVAGNARLARTLDVNLRFVGADGGPAVSGTSLAMSGAGESLPPALQARLVNPQHLDGWRHLPAAALSGGPLLPVGQETMRIEIASDGIYEISYADFVAAGLNADVDPATFEMMHQGLPIAFERQDDGDAVFESGEAIRFFGWNSGRPRQELQYAANNVFWLWAGGTPTTIDQESNEPTYPAAPSFLSSVTEEPINQFFPGWTDQWPSFPNEPDAWFWHRMDRITLPITMSLPHPASSGPDVAFTVEFNSRQRDFDVTIKLNDHPNAATASWSGQKNINLTSTVPITTVVGPTDVVTFTVSGTNALTRYLYLNRVTVDYTRRFVADDDELIFTDEVGGQRRFDVDGFSSDDTSGAAAWDITNPYAPVSIPLGPEHVSAGNSFVYTVGTDHVAGARFIATRHFRQPAGLSRYVPADMDPAAGGAAWLAITHQSLTTPTGVLAAHRQDPLYGGYNTHVVDQEDVVNQFGGGLPTPAAITGFLAYTFANWDPAPAYLLLVGDTNDNPNHDTSYNFPDDNEPVFVHTGYAYKDPYQGRIPSDFMLSLVIGADLIPDIAIGRIAAQTEQEAGNAVQKIIAYEALQLAPEPWQKDILFVADDPDFSDTDPPVIINDFCSWNHVVAGTLPSELNDIVDPFCLPANATQQDVNDLLADLQLNYVNSADRGAMVLNYRGHGSIRAWASNPTLLDTTPAGIAFWQNPTRPTVVISTDCLDGYFAWGGDQGLGETFLTTTAGTAAHFSSTGLGTTDLHTQLATRFYDAILDEGQTALGDAVTSAKTGYLLSNYPQHLLYSFVLQGDPAMNLMRPEVELGATPMQSQAMPGDSITFSFSLENNAILPVSPDVVITLDAGLAFETVNGPVTAVQAGNVITASLTSLLGLDEGAQFTLSARIDPGFAGTEVTVTATASSLGADYALANNSGLATTQVLQPGSDLTLFLPAIQRR